MRKTCIQMKPDYRFSRFLMFGWKFQEALYVLGGLMARFTYTAHRIAQRETRKFVGTEESQKNHIKTI